MVPDGSAGGLADGPADATPDVVRVPPGLVLIAVLSRDVARYAEPGGAPAGIVPGRWRGAGAALPVVEQRPGWLRVRLAQRPNGSTGWLRRADVGLATSPYRIEIDALSARLRLYDHGVEVMDVPAGIGIREQPTPTGGFFVALLEPPPGPDFGDVVLVTSAHSPAATDVDSSPDASVAILGPLGADGLIGQRGARVSRACVRLHPPDLRRLRAVPAGTPVDILTEVAV
jgi:hypothetical protein